MKKLLKMIKIKKRALRRRMLMRARVHFNLMWKRQWRKLPNLALKYYFRLLKTWPFARFLRVKLFSTLISSGKKVQLSTIR